MTLSHRSWALAILGALLAVRLAHLVGPLDEPMWRQTDTAYMARRMMSESPPDLLNPKAPYRGTNDVKAAEFPIYPATVAMVYKALGRESLPAARGVTLLYFAGSAWFLFLAVRLLAGSATAWWTTVFYCAAPLSITISRMVHPDFCIVFFSHLFLYALLRFVQSGRWRWWGISTLSGSAAFLMKAPYCFYLGLVPGFWWLVDRDKRTLGRWIGLASVLVLPLMAAVWFNNHRIAQEAPFDESLVYPMKWTAESSAGRFFGHLQDRADGEGWKLIAKRTIFLVLTPMGILLGLLGLGPRRREHEPPTDPARWAHGIWLLGTGLYVLLVFPMVIGGHEYYTLPLVAPCALLAARGLLRVLGWAEDRLGWWPPVTTGVMLVLLAAGIKEGLARGPYLDKSAPSFMVDWQRVRAGEAIAQFTRPQDLVLSVTHGRSTGWSDPRILYHADRLGWSIEARNLTPSNLAAFVAAGARVAAVLVTPEAESREEELGPLAGRPYASIPLTHSGQSIGTMRFYPLASKM